MIAICVFIAFFAFFAYAQFLDANISQKGFAKGYVEGNELASKIFGKQPKLWQLIAYNVGRWAVMALLPALVMSIFWTYGGTVALGGRHLMAVRRWKRAFATNGESLFESKTAWQKILGL